MIPQSKIQNRKWAGLSVIAFVLVVTGAVAQAQQPAKLYRIGVLSGGFPRSSSDIEALRQGLRDLGYVEGKNLVLEYRYAEANRDRYPDLLADLYRLKVDIIIGDGTGPAVAAKKATSTIPIVMTSTTDPVGNGLVASLARPGGNVTGLTNISGELGGKLLELLKEIDPKLNRVAIVIPGGPAPANKLFVKETEVPARALKVSLYPWWFGDRKITRAPFELRPKNGLTLFSAGCRQVLLLLSAGISWS